MTVSTCISASKKENTAPLFSALPQSLLTKWSSLSPPARSHLWGIGTRSGHPQPQYNCQCCFVPLVFPHWSWGCLWFLHLLRLGFSPFWFSDSKPCISQQCLWHSLVPLEMNMNHLTPTGSGSVLSSKSRLMTTHLAGPLRAAAGFPDGAAPSGGWLPGHHPSLLGLLTPSCCSEPSSGDSKVLPNQCFPWWLRSSPGSQSMSVNCRPLIEGFVSWELHRPGSPAPGSWATAEAPMRGSLKRSGPEAERVHVRPCPFASWQPQCHSNVVKRASSRAQAHRPVNSLTPRWRGTCVLTNTWVVTCLERFVHVTTPVIVLRFRSAGQKFLGLLSFLGAQYLAQALAEGTLLWWCSLRSWLRFCVF